MAFQESTSFCNNCEKQVLIRREVANDLLHAIVTLFLCGLWLPIWVIAALSPGPWRCASCGSLCRSKGSTGAGTSFLVVGAFAVLLVVALLVAIGNLGMGHGSSSTFQSVANSLSGEQQRLAKQTGERDAEALRPEKPARPSPAQERERPKPDKSSTKPSPPVNSDLPEAKPIEPAKPNDSDKAKPTEPTKETQDEQRAASKLKIAKRLWEEGGKEKAADVRDLLEELIRRFPMTEASKEAKALLGKLPAK